jgi:O-antigen/teichoic acid export membrane protein
MILTMIVSLYTSRVILNTLGVEDYGIYNVVGGVVTMFAFFNSAMSSATQRFLSFEIGKGDFVQLRKTFNATQIIHIGIAVLIFILAETVGLWFVKTYLVIPPERLQSAIWVYHFSVLSFMVSIIQVPYNATIIAHERMNVYAYVSIIEVSLKLLIVFMLTWITYDKLKLYGILHFGVVFIIAAIYRVYTRSNFEESKFELVKDQKLYKTLISYSGWSLFGNIAGVAQGQGVNIILNFFFGPVLNAARGIAIQVQSALQAFVSNFQIAVNPQIIKYYSADNKDYLLSLVIRSSKLSFYLFFSLSLPILLEVDLILKLWLNIVPDFAVIFTKLVLISILISCISGPLQTLVQATGKIRNYQIIISFLLLLILPLSYIFLKNGYPPEITLYITIVIELFALLFRLLLLKKLINFPLFIYLKEVLAKNILIVILALLLTTPFVIYFESSNIRLVFMFLFSLCVNFTLIYHIGLVKNERNFIKNFFRKFFIDLTNKQ